jgi:hypothetical protein
MFGNGALMTGMIIMMVRRGMEVSGQKMGMIIVLLCGAVLGPTIRISAVPLTAATTPAATTSTTTVFGWCAVPGGLCNPFSLFSLFTLIPYFFSFLFFPALRRVDFGVIWAHAMRPYGFWGYLGAPEGKNPRIKLI